MEYIYFLLLTHPKTCKNRFYPLDIVQRKCHNRKAKLECNFRNVPLTEFN